MKRILIILIAIAVSTIACKQNKKEASSSKMETVMAVHDSLMPKMNTLTQLVGELNTKIDTTETGLKYKKAQEDLQAAHKSMMEWMKGFGDRFDHEEILKGKALSEEKKKWLDEEEVKVNKLKEQINSSIKNAQELLSKKE
ncbi:hypothetical protein OOZ15_17815 [Galbibacter sp. EGI 63066]|uniref:hypothetical protein n=1 Tax=Galbibacter sp. EGI 63066 TaxID=2993559 RepID=UPI002249410E|nr:hypothetical protein [Galbibacter sp. EGI 63066]MCX2681816.1 hypothetical protein [Galbibacter sp. EGI 63066]